MSFEKYIDMKTYKSEKKINEKSHLIRMSL